MTINIDWENLGFEYMNLPYRFIAHFKDGQWDAGSLTEDATLHLSESSPALHYGQQAFEGLKAYRTKSGEIQLFRPDQNAERLQRTAQRLLMPQVPTELFINAAKAVVKANHAYVPPYESGGSLYLRPLLIGVGDVIGVQRAKEYIFTVFAMPVGNYFKGGLAPTKFIISRDFDRAAPHGTGAAKVGGNYAASLLPGQEAHDAGYSDVIYLDPSTHTKIEEVGSANFFGITKDNEFVTPLSPSILPSITKYS
ncbi:MAG: branched-chain amino acid aminotransferase, partial [Lactococcus chungangensis]